MNKKLAEWESLVPEQVRGSTREIRGRRAYYPDATGEFTHQRDYHAAALAAGVKSFFEDFPSQSLVVIF